jgi:hypothetical protein
VRRDDAGLPWPQDAHDAIVSAVERCLVDGPRTPDMGGTADTTQVGAPSARSSFGIDQRLDAEAVHQYRQHD